MNTPTPEDKAKAISLLIDMVVDEQTTQEDHDAALAIIGLLADDGNNGTCLNHVADSWGACENCGMLVF